LFFAGGGKGKKRIRKEGREKLGGGEQYIKKLACPSPSREGRGLKIQRENKGICRERSKAAGQAKD